MMGRIGILVSPGTAVPMGTYHDAAGFVGLGACYDVVSGKRFSVIASESGMLESYGAPETGEFLSDILSAGFVGNTSQSTWTEIALTFYGSQGTVRVKARDVDRRFFLRGVVARVGSFTG